MSDRLTRCRYLRKDSNQCTAEAVDDQADILLCIKHMARVIEMVKSRTR